MEDPSETLREEHAAVEHLLAAIDGLAEHVRKSGQVPAKDFERAMTVVTEFADRCHHAKEEKVLFPALSRASPKVGAEIARRLTSDHKAFRQLVASTRDLMPKADEPQARSLLVKNLGTYTRLLREHILVENEQLLPEVARSLTPAERARIAEEFERVEEAEVGRGMHEKYHVMIHALADKYAG